MRHAHTPKGSRDPANAPRKCEPRMRGAMRSILDRFLDLRISNFASNAACEKCSGVAPETAGSRGPLAAMSDVGASGLPSMFDAAVNALAEASGAALLAVDAEGRILSHSERFDRMWDVPPKVL